MPGDETLQPTHDESESEEEEVEADVIPKVDIDPSTLTPLSPEVISKQVRIRILLYCNQSCIKISYPIGQATINLGTAQANREAKSVDD